MGFITDIIERRGKTMIDDYNTGQWPSLQQYLSQAQSNSGVNVSATAAINFIAVYACVRLLSETEASIPLFVYKRVKDGKEKRPDHPLYKILHDQANRSMTAFQFRQTLMVHLLLWGNAYAEKIYDYTNGGKISELWPLRPDRMKVEGTIQDPIYRYSVEGGTDKVYTRDQILHIPALSFDGLVGYPPITVIRESVGLGLALEQFGATYFKNGTNLGGVAEHPGKLSDKALASLRKNLEENFTGVAKANRMIILEEGMKYQKIGIPPEDAQFLQTRQFQKREIASFFNVPAHMINDLEHATFSNIEHQAIQYVVYSVRPWLVRIEQEIQKSLLTQNEQGKYFAEHQVDGLLRGDAKTRMEALQMMRQNAIINADEWRAIENMNPLEDEVSGKAYLANGALTPVGQLGQTKGGGTTNGEGTQGAASAGSDDPQNG